MMCSAIYLVSQDVDGVKVDVQNIYTGNVH